MISRRLFIPGDDKQSFLWLLECHIMVKNGRKYKNIAFHRTIPNDELRIPYPRGRAFDSL